MPCYLRGNPLGYLQTAAWADRYELGRRIYAPTYDYRLEAKANRHLRRQTMTT